jgi:hypothetical protein
MMGQHGDTVIDGVMYFDSPNRLKQRELLIFDKLADIKCFFSSAELIRRK